MKTLCSILLLTSLAAAQSTANPVVTSVRQIFERQQKNIIAAAEEMPADKYSFHPTEGQMPFAQLMAHIAGSNAMLCNRIGGQTAPANLQVKAGEGKDKIVAAVKASFDFCSTALQNVDDSKLGEEVSLFGGRKGPKAYALIALTNDFADHYAAAAGYLRAAGLTPPSAQRQQGMGEGGAAKKQ